MGSPELTKMADFVEAGCPRSTQPSRTWLRLRSKIGLARPERPPHWGRCSGAPAARYGRRDRRDAVLAIAGSALTDRPAGGAIARPSALPG
jgi:hypothetical protein